MNNIDRYEKIPPDPTIRLLRYPCRSYSFYSHWHEHTEIHFILSGSCRLKCGEESCALEAGDCAVINSCELHEGIGGSCSYLCLILPPSFFESEHVLFTRVIRDAYLSEIITQIDARYSSDAAPDRLEVKGYACLLISHLMRKYTRCSLSDIAYAGYTAKQSKINEAVRYIGENYDTPLTTRQLADRLYLSESYFCKIFKEVTGRTAIDYINRFRIDKAEKLLRQTGCTVAEAAQHCGFCDANYFTRLYKKILGCPPSAHRAEFE